MIPSPAFSIMFLLGILGLAYRTISAKRIVFGRFYRWIDLILPLPLKAVPTWDIFSCSLALTCSRLFRELPSRNLTYTWWYTWSRLKTAIRFINRSHPATTSDIRQITSLDTTVSFVTSLALVIIQTIVLTKLTSGLAFLEPSSSGWLRTIFAIAPRVWALRLSTTEALKFVIICRIDAS